MTAEGKYSRLTPTMFRWVAKNSTKPMTNITEVSLILIIKLLPIWGMMFRSAWGMMTFTMVCTWVMPMALAPSVWPGSIEIIPPRTLSAMYAPVFMETMMKAAVQSPALPRNASWPPLK